jgi:hypothetical protein
VRDGWKKDQLRSRYSEQEDTPTNDCAQDRRTRKCREEEVCWKENDGFKRKREVLLVCTKRKVQGLGERRFWDARQ